MEQPLAAVEQPTGTYGFRAMGTDWEVLTCPDDGGAAGARVERRAVALEARFSRFRDDSELSKVNRRRGEWVVVSAEMFEVVGQALQARERSGGLFDPLLLEAMVASGYEDDFDVGRVVGSSPPPVGGGAIELDARARRVRLTPDTGLDLGGFVKGWAVDRLVEEVGDNGVLNAGGDLRAVGPADEGYGWVIGVEDPRYPQRDSFLIAAQDEAVATSGINRRHWTAGGVAMHHIIDPRTRRPAETDVVTATVIAATCSDAEVAARAALILGSETGVSWLTQRRLAGVVIRADGSWVASPAMAGRFL